MCVKCAISDAANAGDWKTVKRLATEADKGKHDDEMPLPADAVVEDEPDDEPAKKSSTASKSSS